MDMGLIFSNYYREKPQNHEDWLRLLQKQEVLHRKEMDHWQRFLDAAINLLKQVVDFTILFSLEF
jgi:hypothetical protein